MDWMQILSAAFMAMMIVYLYPRAKQMLKNSPKAEPGQWQSALIPIGLVVLFVILLIKMV